MRKKIFLCFLFLYAFVGTKAEEPDYTKPVFLPNQGQWPSYVLYRASLRGGVMYVTQTGLALQFWNPEYSDRHHHDHGEDHYHKHEADLPSYTMIYLDWEGGNVDQCKEEHPLSTSYSFINGNDPSKWASGISGFEQLILKDVYPGIDIKLYSKNGNLKYDYHVSSGADHALIKESISGAEVLVKEGSPKLKTALRDITYQPAIAFAYEDSSKKVGVTYCVKDSTITYNLIKRDIGQAITIDPELVFSTYSGSAADNWGNSATFDLDGNLYSTGTVFESDSFPIPPTGYDRTYNGVDFTPFSTFDMLILKFSSDGRNLLAATYLGGSGVDVPSSTIVDNAGNFIVFGSTSSLDYPTTSSTYDGTFNGGTNLTLAGVAFQYTNGSDLFITKLDNNLSTLLASTYVGGAGNEGATVLNSTALAVGRSLVANYGDEVRGEVKIDNRNNIYIASHTYSPNFPIVNGFQNTLAGSYDGVVAKFNAGLTTLLFSTYIGGGTEDACYSMAIAQNEEVYVTGGTNSSNFPTAGSPLSANASGRADGFVARISASGNTLLSSTYVGTNSYDQSYFIDFDSAGNVFIFGQTEGTYPVSGVGTTNVPYSNLRAGQFIQKLDRQLSTSLMSTVFGSDNTGSPIVPNIVPTAFLVDRCNRIYITGWGGAAGNPTSYDKGFTTGMPVNLSDLTGSSTLIKGSTDGWDFYLGVLSKDAEDLLFGGFFGATTSFPTTSGEHVDGGTCRFDENGIVYHAVCASCANIRGAFPATPGAYASEEGAGNTNCNNAAFKLDLSILEARIATSDTAVCAGEEITLENNSVGGSEYEWDFDDGTTLKTLSPSITYSWDTPGTYQVSLFARNASTCIIEDEEIVTIEVRGVPEIPDETLLNCPGDLVNLSGPINSDYEYQWTTDIDSLLLIDNELPIISFVYPSTPGTIQLEVTDIATGCNTTTTYFIEVPENNLPTDSIRFCFGQSFSITPSFLDTTGTALWSPSDLFDDPSSFRPTLTLEKDTTVTLEYTTPGDACTFIKDFRLFTEPLAADFEVDFEYEQCKGMPIFSFENRSSGYEQLTWFFGVSINSTDSTFISLEENPVFLFTDTGLQRVTLLIDNGFCTEEFSQEISVQELPLPNVITPNGDGINDNWVISDRLENWSVEIYNRWGRKVFESDNYRGEFDGSGLSDGTYYYRMVPSNGERHCEGWITIMR